MNSNLQFHILHARREIDYLLLALLRTALLGTSLSFLGLEKRENLERPRLARVWDLG